MVNRKDLLLPSLTKRMTWEDLLADYMNLNGKEKYANRENMPLKIGS